MLAPSTHDVIIVGGGLSGALLAWRLKVSAPRLRLCLIERGDVLGGNHTWSFFDTDMTPEQHAFLSPVVGHHWARNSVRFPGFARTLAVGYNSIASPTFHAVVNKILGDCVRFGSGATSVTDESVSLQSGETLTAPCVVDARGVRDTPHLLLGFQKFVGLEVATEGPHGLADPIIMDASVPQNDGYRFVYSLPLAPDRLLIEDTYYSDGRDLPQSTLIDRIKDYAQGRGWRIASILRSERGVLPIILAGDYAAMARAQATGPATIGLAAGLFHPTTGYSLRDALGVAELVAARVAASNPTTADLRDTLLEHGRRLWEERTFFRFLNRLLFQAGRPAERYRIMARFYRLDAGLIERFYAARLTATDKASLLIGKPPVSILRALGCISERQAFYRGTHDASQRPAPGA